MGWWWAAIRKYAVFRGRARRREYWYFVLFTSLFLAVAAFAIGLCGAAAGADDSTSEGLFDLLALPLLLPYLAVKVRRLHDSGKSGWWLLLSFIPLIGALVLLIFYCEDSQSGMNKYGPNPKEPLATAASLPVTSS